MLETENCMLESMHILITGASSGLGEALALDYAAGGVVLSLTGRDEARLRAVADEAGRRGSQVVSPTLDVTDRQRLKGWILERDAALPVDLVIANAGISAGTRNGKESEEQSSAIMDVNLNGVLNTIYPLIPAMCTRGRGQIAIMSSLAGFRGFAGAPAYCASKAAARVYGEALRGDLLRHGVRVNVICPGFVKTPMTDVNRFYMPFLMSPERAAKIMRRGLEKDKARIAFPWRMYALVRLFAALPDWLLNMAARWMPRKGI